MTLSPEEKKLRKKLADKKYKEKVRASRIVKLREYNGRNKERMKLSQSLHKDNNPEWYLLKAAQYRAKKNDLDIDITIDDIFIPTHCPVLGIKLKTGSGPRSYNSASLDRIDNTKGYVKGNVAVISDRANSLKSNATIEELKLVTRYMEEHNVI